MMHFKILVSIFRRDRFFRSYFSGIDYYKSHISFIYPLLLKFMYFFLQIISR
jgi:hypothetical protein